MKKAAGIGFIGPRRSVSIERSVKFDNEAEILLPNSAPLEGEDFSPLLKNPSQFEQPTVPNPPCAPIISENPATTFTNNPTVDHLGHDFKPPLDNQGRPKQICQESATIRCLCDGEGFISDRPSKRNELPQGIQKADKAVRMVQSDNWEVVDLGIGDMSSRMVAAMAEADALEPTYEEVRGQSDWPLWKDAIKVELEAL